MVVNIINDNIDKIIMSETDTAMQENEGKMKIELGFELNDARIKTGVVTLCVAENKVVTSKGTEVTPTGPWGDFEFTSITALLDGEGLVSAVRDQGEEIMVTVLAVVEPIREKVVSYYTQLMSKYEDPNQDFHNEGLVEPTMDSADGTVPENETMGFKHLESYEDSAYIQAAKQNEDTHVIPKKNIMHQQYGGDKTNGDLNKAVEAAMRYVSDTQPVNSTRVVYGVGESGNIEMRGIIKDCDNQHPVRVFKQVHDSGVSVTNNTNEGASNTGIDRATSDVLRNERQQLRQQHNALIQGEYTEVGEVTEKMYNSPAFQHLIHGDGRVMENAVIQGANANEAVNKNVFFTINGEDNGEWQRVEHPTVTEMNPLTDEMATKAFKLVEGIKNIPTDMPIYHSDSESANELAKDLANSIQSSEEGGTERAVTSHAENTGELLRQMADSIVNNGGVEKTGNPFKDYGLNADLDISNNLVPTLREKYLSKLNELAEKGAKADKVVEKVNLIFKQQQIALIQKLQAKRAEEANKRERLIKEAEEQGKPAPILEVGHSASCSSDVETDVNEIHADGNQQLDEAQDAEKHSDTSDNTEYDFGAQRVDNTAREQVFEEQEEDKDGSSEDVDNATVGKQCDTSIGNVEYTPSEEGDSTVVESEVNVEEFLSDEVEQEVTFVGEEGTANNVVGQEPLFNDSDVQEESYDKSRLECASKGNADTDVSGDSAVNTGNNSMDDVINISDFDNAYQEFITGLKWNTVEFKEVSEDSAKYRKRFDDIVYMLWQAKCSNMNTIRVIIGFDDEPIAMGDFIVTWGSGIEFKGDRRIEAFHNDATLRCVYPGYPVNLKVGVTAVLSQENNYITLIDIYCDSEVRTSYVSMDLWNYVTVLQETIEGIVACM